MDFKIKKWNSAVLLFVKLARSGGENVSTDKRGTDYAVLLIQSGLQGICLAQYYCSFEILPIQKLSLKWDRLWQLASKNVAAKIVVNQRKCVVLARLYLKKKKIKKEL